MNLTNTSCLLGNVMVSNLHRALITFLPAEHKIIEEGQPVFDDLSLIDFPQIRTIIDELDYSDDGTRLIMNTFAELVIVSYDYYDPKTKVTNAKLWRLSELLSDYNLLNKDSISNLSDDKAILLAVAPVIIPVFDVLLDGLNMVDIYENAVKLIFNKYEHQENREMIETSIGLINLSAIAEGFQPQLPENFGINPRKYLTVLSQYFPLMLSYDDEKKTAEEAVEDFQLESDLPDAKLTPITNNEYRTLGAKLIRSNDFYTSTNEQIESKQDDIYKKNANVLEAKFDTMIEVQGIVAFYRLIEALLAEKQLDETYFKHHTPTFLKTMLYFINNSDKLVKDAGQDLPSLSTLGPNKEESLTELVNLIKSPLQNETITQPIIDRFDVPKFSGEQPEVSYEMFNQHMEDISAAGREKVYESLVANIFASKADTIESVMLYDVKFIKELEIFIQSNKEYPIEFVGPFIEYCVNIRNYVDAVEHSKTPEEDLESGKIKLPEIPVFNFVQ